MKALMPTSLPAAADLYTTAPPLACFDCGLIYGSDGWIDAVVPDDVWEIINPSGEETGGTLCISCMARRCLEAGLNEVPVKLASGPFIT